LMAEESPSSVLLLYVKLGPEERQRGVSGPSVSE
jgi:hypothetical protein